MNDVLLQIENGTVTLPARLRARYKLEEGDALALVDVGGVFILSPTKSVIPELARSLEQKRRAAGLSVADLLEGLDEQRRIYARENYGIASPAPSGSKSSYRRRRARRGRVLHDRR